MQNSWEEGPVQGFLAKLIYEIIVKGSQDDKMERHQGWGFPQADVGFLLTLDSTKTGKEPRPCQTRTQRNLTVALVKAIETLLMSSGPTRFPRSHLE
jgi:hypothetical protein